MGRFMVFPKYIDVIELVCSIHIDENTAPLPILNIWGEYLDNFFPFRYRTGPIQKSRNWCDNWIECERKTFHRAKRTFGLSGI